MPPIVPRKIISLIVPLNFIVKKFCHVLVCSTPSVWQLPPLKLYQDGDKIPLRNEGAALDACASGAACFLDRGFR